MNGSSICRNAGRPWRHRRAALAAAVWIAATGTSLAAGDGRALSQYIRDEWRSDRGFPGGQVFAMAQTADGYLWIGAEKGLVRFDGVTFRLFDPGSDVGAGPAVLGVTAAPDGSLWARLRGIALRCHPCPEQEG